MTESLAGQVAIVTGGGRGLGRAFALALAQAGAAVAVTARTKSQVDETAAMITSAGGKALPFVADSLDAAAAKHVLRETERCFGPVDLLVNNAGILTAIGREWDVDPDEWWTVVTSNLKGPYTWTRAVLDGMLQRGRGRIVNVSSIGAYADFPEFTAYCAAKAALTNFSHNLHLAVKDRGVRVFALAPAGWTTMQETIVRAPTASQATRDAFMGIKSVAPDWQAKSVNLLMQLACGKLDSLAGRHLSFLDDPEMLTSRATEILEKDLLTLRRLESPVTG